MDMDLTNEIQRRDVTYRRLSLAESIPRTTHGYWKKIFWSMSAYPYQYYFAIKLYLELLVVVVSFISNRTQQ